MTTAEILRAAADLIEPEGAWTQGVYARTKNGYGTIASDQEAVSWCALGALRRVDPQLRRSDAADVLLRVLGGDGIPNWNDDPERTQADVVAKLREAADLAERGEA